MIDIKGKWAFITGAARGIGYEAALFMAKYGCNLILHSRSLEHTKKVLSDVKELGVEAWDVAAELSDLDAVNGMLDAIEASGAQVDIVLNNSAIQTAFRQEYTLTPPSEFAESFLVNTTVPAMICYRFLPGMRKRGFGRIVNTTSGIRELPQLAAYSASKAALDKFTADLAPSLSGTNVLMNLTDPGWCKTDLGGQNAPCSPQSAVPGVCVGAFVDDGRSGRLFRAQEFTGMSLEEAVRKAESM